MAIYHLHVKNISRGDGRSVVAAAAYRAGETLVNEAEERLSEFGGRRDVLASEVLVPTSAPAWMADRTLLWNAVEAREKRKDARLAKEIEFALPRELPAAQWLDVVRRMARVYVGQGFVVDLAVHDDGTQHNPHAHLLLTTRAVGPDGFGGKVRSADGLQFVTEARVHWARIANEALGRIGSGATVDDRSLAAQGKERTATRHRGPDPDERRARRERRDQERRDDEMTGRELPTGVVERADDGDPVPDPQGEPIHPNELARGEDRMLEAMHREAVWRTKSAGGRIAAEDAVLRQAAIEVGDDAAQAYRLAPQEENLDWLLSPEPPASKGSTPAPAPEDDLDWLRSGPQANETTAEERDREPERWPRR